MANIDWGNAKRQIRQSYILKDDEVEICLAALAHARELYPEFYVPERLNLTNNNGHVLHTIITHGAKPTSVSVGPRNNIMIRNKFLYAFGAAIVVGTLAYYLYDI